MIRTAIHSPTKHGAFAVVRMGRWIPTTLETDGIGSMAAARRVAENLNHEYDLQQARSSILDVAPADRPIVAGFYTDDDAR